MNKGALFVVILLVLIVVLLVALFAGLGPFAGAPKPAATPGAADVLEIANEATPKATVSAGAPTPAPIPTPSVDQLSAMLQSQDWQQRLAGAGLLAERGDIPVEKRVDLLATALGSEIGRPTQGIPPDGAYLPTTDIVRLQLTRSMGKLGAAGQAGLRAQAAATTGEMHERAVLALGYAGDRSVVAEVRQILLKSGSASVRMDAAHLLGQLKDPAARPELEKALQDAYGIEHTQLSGFSGKVYPVREQAAAALAALGVKIEIVDHGVYRINP
jgi:HEAT repeat protein